MSKEQREKMNIEQACLPQACLWQNNNQVSNLKFQPILDLNFANWNLLVI